MDELRESSLLFSLEGLMETERERVQREAREAQKRRDEELSRVAELAERRRVAAQQERQSRERRQLLEQERERVEQRQLDALKQATIERARLDAETKLQLVEAEQARQHELKLSKLQERQRTARYRTLTWLSAGSLLASVAGAFAAYLGLIEPAHARELAHLQSVISTGAEQAKTTERALSLERSKNQTLSERVRQLEEKQTEPVPAAKAQKPRPPIGPIGPIGPVVTSDCPDDGDPLKPCLKGPSRRAR